MSPEASLIWTLACLLILRNCFYLPQMDHIYTKVVPMVFVKGIVRVANNRFNGKDGRSLLRNYFFNCMRNCLPFVQKSIIITGQLNTLMTLKLMVWTFFLTVVFQLLPKSLLSATGPFKSNKSMRVVLQCSLMLLQFEYDLVNAVEIVSNRNSVFGLFQGNLLMFWVVLYLMTNSNLTASVVEGYCFENMSIL